MSHACELRHFLGILFFKIRLTMQSSQTSENLSDERTHFQSHQPVKQVRSHESHQSNHSHGKYRKNRSLSAGFRHSIRNLTSCALAR